MLFLCLKALSLVDRVVKLGVCVSKLSSRCEKLEALYKLGHALLSLCKRRNLYGIIVDERRLEQIFLYLLFESRVEDISPCIGSLDLKSELCCGFLRLIEIADKAAEVDARVFLYGVDHRDTLERL